DLADGVRGQGGAGKAHPGSRNAARAPADPARTDGKASLEGDLERDADSTARACRSAEPAVPGAAEAVRRRIDAAPVQDHGGARTQAPRRAQPACRPRPPGPPGTPD